MRRSLALLLTLGFIGLACSHAETAGRSAISGGAGASTSPPNSSPSADSGAGSSPDAGSNNSPSEPNDGSDAGRAPPEADGGSLAGDRDAGPVFAADAGEPIGSPDAGGAYPQDAGAEVDFSVLIQQLRPDAGTPTARALRSHRLGRSYPNPCGPAINEGRVLSWVAPQSGTLRVIVSSATAHQQLLQVDCGTLISTKACAPDAETSELAVAIEESQQLCWLLGFEGEASVLATLAPAICGDGVVNRELEQCDFGDTLNGDGCDSNCQFETPTMNDGDTCLGVAQSIFDEVVVRGFTVGYSDQAPATCGGLPGANDKHHLIIPKRSGRLKLQVTANFDAVLSVFTSCRNLTISDLLACSDGPRADAVERIEIPVTEDEHYYVAVDGYAPTSLGAYTLSMTVTPELDSLAASVR